MEEFSEEEKLAFEKEFLGLYLTSHPQVENLQKVRNLITHEIDALEEEKEGAKVTIGGLIESTKKVFTRKTNSEMAFVTISDERGLIAEVIIFPKIYDLFKAYLIQDTVVIIDGKIDSKNEKQIIIAEKISKISN